MVVLKKVSRAFVSSEIMAMVTFRRNTGRNRQHMAKTDVIFVTLPETASKAAYCNAHSEHCDLCGFSLTLRFGDVSESVWHKWVKGRGEAFMCSVCFSFYTSS